MKTPPRSVRLGFQHAVVPVCLSTVRGPVWSTLVAAPQGAGYPPREMRVLAQEMGGDPRAPERCSRAGHRCPRTEDLRPRAEWGCYHWPEGSPRDGQRRPRQRELRPRSVQRGPRAKWGRRLPGESPVSGQKAAPGGKIRRVGRENEFIVGIRCDGPDRSTAPARCVSPASRTPVPDAEIRRTASPEDREPGLTFSKSPCLLHSQSSFLVFHRLHELR